MPEVVTLPAALLVAADYLRADLVLQGLIEGRVYTRLPSALILPLIRLQRIGGAAESPEGWLDRPRIQVEAWGNTDPEAERVAREARRAFFALRNYRHASGVAGGVREVLGLQSLPDPVTDRPRWLFDVELILHP